MKWAIKGHHERGNEVIEILEMLGGINELDLKGIEANSYYYIDNINNNKIRRGISIYPYEYIIYTLEEFLEKFPYKVGDKVLYKIYGIYSRIKSMLWNVEKGQVFYRLDSNKLFVATADELKLCKEETMEDKLEQITFDIPNGYEFFGINDDNQVVLAKKQPQYPKTFIEVLNFWHPDRQTEDDYQRYYKKDLIEKFQDLLYARDAYWKIAGEEMGLGKPWKPDWTKADERKYCIVNTEGNITKWVQKTTNKILAFPTKEMRDAFYENFNELIVNCKELL
jgi:hypothetical protein